MTIVVGKLGPNARAEAQRIMNAIAREHLAKRTDLIRTMYLDGRSWDEIADRVNAGSSEQNVGDAKTYERLFSKTGSA